MYFEEVSIFFRIKNVIFSSSRVAVAGTKRILNCYEITFFGTESTKIVRISGKR